MKNSKILWFISIVIILHSCKDDDNAIIVSPVYNCPIGNICYKENDVRHEFVAEIEKHQDDVFVFGDLFDISMNIHDLEEKTYYFNAGTKDEARAVRLASDSVTVDHFSTSVKNKYQGEFKINDIDLVNQTISGIFNFTLTQFSGVDRTVLVLDSGIVQNVPIVESPQLNSNGTFSGKFVPSDFDSLAFYFLSTLNFDDRIEISMAHPSGNRFTIKYPKRLESREYSVPRTELLDNDNIQINLRTSRNSEPYYIPSTVNRPKMIVNDYSETDLRLNFDLLGEFEREDGTKIDLKSFNVDLHNW